MRKIEQVSCSLNLGLIYSVNYSYSPRSGCGITIQFVNQAGIYTQPVLLQKAFIRIGAASFSMYAISSKISYGPGRRTIEVTFVDDTYKLDNYLVVLTGRGCGYNVFPLGSPVDKRTPAQKLAAALDKSAQQIIDFTQFPDIEYTFDAFLTVLRGKFNVQVGASYNGAITNAFVGTFRDVLSQWCSFFNLTYFLENGIVKIFNPVTLSIVLPTQPIDAIEWEEEIDAESTYGKTCFNWFQQEGGQFSLNQTSNQNGDLLVRTETLFPAGYEFNLPQPTIDLNQVAAAQYGEQFWFLYNFVKGTTAEQCGWAPLPVTGGGSAVTSTLQSLSSNGFGLVLQDNDIFQGRFEAYQTYGQTLAGRVYLSSEKSELAIDQGFTWFDESQGQIFNFTNVDDRSVSINFLTPVGIPSVGNDLNQIPGTIINQYYPGVNYRGNRMAYIDTTPVSGNFNLGSTKVGIAYNNVFTVGGASSYDFSAFDGYATGNNILQSYNKNASIPQDVQLLINDIPNKTSVFAPRFTSVPLKGIRYSDYASLKSSQNEPDSVGIINNSQGPSVVGNTAVIKTLKQGAYTVYYDKYQTCSSAHSAGPYFQHRFDPRQISIDNSLIYSFTKRSNNSYLLNRNYSTINALVNNPLLPALAQARSFPTRKVTYSLNRFDNIPVNFLSNGLVNMSVSVAGDGVTATYTFSNEVLEVPYPENRYNEIDQILRNSAVRQYHPNQVIT